MKKAIFTTICLSLISMYAYSQDWVEHNLLSGAEEIGDLTRVESGDLDGDGDLELIIMGDNMSYFDNLGDGSFGPRTVIHSGWGLSWGTNLNLYDKDNDGDNDILAITGNNEPSWLVNNGASGFSVEIIGTFVYGVNSVALNDLDGDGDLDVVSASNQIGIDNNEQMIWFENTDGSNSNYTSNQIMTGVGFRRFVFAEDIDGDNDNDIVTMSSSTNQMVWLENDGSGNFANEAVLIGTSGDMTMAFMTDFNNDNLPDVVYSTKGTNGHYVRWARNEGNGTFSSQANIASTVVSGSYGLSHCYPVDMDLDGDMDIIEGETYFDRIRYFENDGTGSFTFKENVFYDDGYSVYFVCAGDLDGDDYPDPACYYDTDPTSGFFDNISWFESNLAPSLSASLEFVTCNINGTSLDDTDDRIEVSVLIDSKYLSDQFSASSSSGSVTPASGSTINGAVTLLFDPGTAGDGDLVLTIEDLVDPTYTYDLAITDPGTCATPIVLTGAASQIECNDNGTPSVDTDDFISFQLMVDAAGHIGTATLTSPNISISPNTVNYGEETTISLSVGTAGMGDVQLLITDNIYPSVTEMLEITDPFSCSSIVGETQVVYPDTPVSAGRLGTSLVMNDNIAMSLVLDMVPSNSAEERGIFVYEKADGQTDWNQIETIQLPEYTNGQDAGVYPGSMFLSDNYLIIGNRDAGNALVFERNGNTLGSMTTISSPTGSGGFGTGYFGTAVAITDQYAFVGAPTISNQGTVRVFEKIGNTWTHIDDLVFNNPNAYDRFGEAITVTDDFVIVGTWGANSSTGSGAVSIFRKNDVSGSFDLLDVFENPNGFNIDHFGKLIDASNNRLIISSNNSVRVLAYDGVNWNLEFVTNDLEGTALNYPEVKIHGDYFLANNDWDGANSTNEVFLYKRTGSTWAYERSYNPTAGGASQHYAESFDISNEGVVVGAPNNSDLTSSNGALFFYSHSAEEAPLSAVASSVSCNDNQTPIDAIDDFIEASVLVSGGLAGNPFIASVSSGTVSPSSGTLGTGSVLFQFGSGSPGNGDIVLHIEDANNPTSFVDVTITDPGACNIVPQLVSAASNISCNDNDTPNDDTDDYISFDLVVNTDDLEGAYMLSNGDGLTVTPSTANYGETITFVLPSGTAGGGDVNISIVDQTHANVTDNIIITDPLVCSNAVGIEDLDGNKIDLEVYPNPASNILYVSSDKEEIAEIIILNILGKEMKSIKELNSIQISDLPTGNYFLKILTKSEKEARVKFMKL